MSCIRFNDGGDRPVTVSFDNYGLRVETWVSHAMGSRHVSTRIEPNKLFDLCASDPDLRYLMLQAIATGERNDRHEAALDVLRA
jgi:hypothetical protein